MPISCQQDLLIRKSRQTGRAAVALDLQPFTLLPPPQVFLAKNLHNSSCTNRVKARFVGWTYGMLHNERCPPMSARVPHAHSSWWDMPTRASGYPLPVRVGQAHRIRWQEYPFKNATRTNQATARFVRRAYEALCNE